MPSVTIPLSFVAGLLSFISPCVLPLVPVYLGYLSGSSLTGDERSRWQIFGNALFFVAGFTFVFVALFGLPTSIVGNLLAEYSDWIARIGGVVAILFGLHTLGVLTIPFLQRTRRLSLGSGIEQGYGRSLLLGVTFAAGWTPCIGPLLGTVMTLALSEPSQSIRFILAYAVGLAIPFLVAAALVTPALSWLKRLNRYLRVVEIASGLLMVTVGILLVSGMFSILNSYLIRLAPEWIYRFL